MYYAQHKEEIFIKVTGIICEYNPFHNGHLHHIEETKNNGATHIVAVMSGNFVQRGDIAIMNKIDRAKLAVKSGVDLVIEIPVAYCLAPAEIYASGAVYLLNAMGVVDEISFGSESGNITQLADALNFADTAIRQNSADILELMSKGYTYPRALTSIVTRYSEQAGDIISKPNNILAIEYMRAMNKYAPDMGVFTVKRKSVPHDGGFSDDGFASASYIREQIKTGFSTLNKFTTPLWYNAIKNASASGELADISRLERIILYKLRTIKPEDISDICDISSGMENRIYNARMAGSLDELEFTVKSKNYTMSRIRRSLLNILIDIKKDDIKILPPYIRILASNERGLDILSEMKNKASLPYNSSLAKLAGISPEAERFTELEAKASDIYGLSLYKIQSAQKDYRSKFVIDLD